MTGEICLAQTRLPSLFAPYQLEPGDFDGDGIRDFYAASESSSGLLLIAERHGAFIGIDDFDLPEDNSMYKARARDFDRDGRTDLFGLMHFYYWQGDAVNASRTGVLLINRGSFTFDFDTQVYLDPVAPILGKESPTTDLEFTLGDFNGDGIDEIFFMPQPHRAQVLAYAPDAPWIYDVVQNIDLTALEISDNHNIDRAIPTVADFDHDGRDDVILSDEMGEVWVLRAGNDFELAPQQQVGQYVLLPHVYTVLIDDLDRDGQLDLVGITHQRSIDDAAPKAAIVLARGDGAGNFSRLDGFDSRSQPAYSGGPGWAPTTAYPRAILLDIDDSGYSALIYAMWYEKTLVVHPQIGLRRGRDAIEYPLGGTPTGVFRDDLADGTVDLLVPVFDDRGTPDDRTDDEHFIDRWRLDP